MDKTILGILIGSFTTLLGVALSSLFNHLTKRKELRHNEYLKELELKDRAKERKFKVEEKMIEKSIEAHMEAFSQLVKIFGLVNEYYSADGALYFPSEEKRKELFDLLIKLDSWRSSKGFFLEKNIRERIGLVVRLAERALRPGTKPDHPKMDIWRQLWSTIQGLIGALETILKEYNPLYDLNIKFPELETL